MLQARQQASFRQEAVAQVRAPAPDEDLQRAAHAQLDMFGPVHRAHAAPSQEADHTIGTQDAVGAHVHARIMAKGHEAGNPGSLDPGSLQ